jgi:hypothetical protein
VASRLLQEVEGEDETYIPAGDFEVVTPTYHHLLASRLLPVYLLSQKIIKRRKDSEMRRGFALVDYIKK